MSTIEAELWRIFTFYALHTDANIPDMWRINHFVRFAKDCQITSSKFMVSELELEIVRLVRNKRKATAAKESSRDFDSSHTIQIFFPDFLRLLEIVAVRLYPSAPNGKVSNMDAAVSLRRLLLENVLLLSSRRSSAIEDICFSSKDADAESAVLATFAKSLNAVFKYYVDKADQRRSQELAEEAVKQGVTRSDVSNKQLTEGEQLASQRIRDALRAQKDLISYKEFTVFCQDFTLKSTALLTAIEVGEVYLNVVPLHPTTKLLRGMSFHTFCHALVALAMLAYRAHSTSPRNKVMALLHFMWKSINQGDTQKKALSRSSTGASHAGSLNQFGGGLFCDYFIQVWTREGYPNYTDTQEHKPISGSELLKRLFSNMRSVGDGEGVAEEKIAEAAAEAAAAAEVEKAKTGGTVVLPGFLLAALFRTRPELSELVYLELLGRKDTIRDV